MSEREYPECPQVAVGAIVIRNRQVLLVRRNQPPSKGLWAIPGGSVELGETLQQAAEREIMEETGITIRAGDTEGVRRALIYLEDEMQRAGGPFLTTRKTTRTPVVRTRIGLHVLMSTPDKSAFFSDAYLNRLAHDGVNGLMLPLFDIYPGRLVPEFEHDPEPMFEQLRQYVQRYARHGIRLFAPTRRSSAYAAARKGRSGP